MTTPSSGQRLLSQMPSYRIGRFNTIPDAAWFLARTARDCQVHGHIPTSDMIFVCQGRGGIRSIAARLVKQRIPFHARHIEVRDGAIICGVSDLEGIAAQRSHCFVLLSVWLGERMVPLCRFLQNKSITTAYLSVCLDGHQDCDALAFHLEAEVSPLIESLESGTVYFRKVNGDWCCYWSDRPAWLVPRLLVRICECLCFRQRAFLDGGIKRLAPLKLSDVASEIGCHLSSVSRLIAGVDAQTEWGRLPLKSLFAGAIPTSDGTLSTTQAKAAVLRAIRSENKDYPLSDDAVAALLKSQGIDISRRTVTKYRMALGIASTRERGAEG
jgi:Sigma-54, DNA binding domain